MRAIQKSFISFINRREFSAMFSFGMTQAGLSHQFEGFPCQDAVHMKKEGRITGICLCDGAGSYALVAEGANAQARTLSSMMARRFHEFLHLPDHILALEFTIAIKEEIRALHDRFAVEDPTAFASTVICAGLDALTRDFLVVHLGDGMAAAVNHGTARLLTHAEHAPSRATQLTINVPDVILSSLRISRGRADALVLSSDGAEGYLYDCDGSVSDTVAQLSSGLRCTPDPWFRKNIERAVHRVGIDDDFSLGILSAGAPTLQELGCTPDQSLRSRRRSKAFIAFARALDCGLPKQQAARRAGWGRKNRGEKLRQALSRHLTI